MVSRVIAVDWSGAVDGAAKKIWLAEVDTRTKDVVRLECGRDRNQLATHILEEAGHRSDLVVGLDFAFSLPSWFLSERNLPDAVALWQLVGREGEQWLTECKPPFWGRGKTRRPVLSEHLRRTDREVPPVGGVRPKSVFQIGGAGTVGTGSIRGMPLLQRLRESGFSVWPFDPIAFPLVIEIYPRLLTGAIVKGDPTSRHAYLAAQYSQLSAEIGNLGASSEDAFDALVSALVMSEHSDDFDSLPPAEDAIRLREGRIWYPSPAPRREFRRKVRDSSKTRVAPVFDAITARDRQGAWVKEMLDIVSSETTVQSKWQSDDFTYVDGYWYPREQSLHPPLSLLSWLIRNLEHPANAFDGDAAVMTKRRKLLQRDPATVVEAINLLRWGVIRGWHILEGPTYPDAFIVTAGALVVAEGKRTEAGPTTNTTYMAGRHQMLRHLDAAWEIRGSRSVYGIMIVESDDATGRVPLAWLKAAADIKSSSVVQSSLPHRGPKEQEAIASAFVGITTWQRLCTVFSIDLNTLPDLIIESAHA
jgi:hypothetical protein